MKNILILHVPICSTKEMYHMYLIHYVTFISPFDNNCSIVNKWGNKVEYEMKE